MARQERELQRGRRYPRAGAPASDARLVAKAVLAALGGGGSTVESGQVSVDFGSGDTTITTTVAAAWVAVGSRIVCSVSATDTADHTGEDVLLEELSASAGNLVVGVSFDLTVHAPNGTHGLVLVDYLGL